MSVRVLIEELEIPRQVFVHVRQQTPPRQRLCTLQFTHPLKPSFCPGKQAWEQIEEPWDIMIVDLQTAHLSSARYLDRRRTQAGLCSWILPRAREQGPNVPRPFPFLASLPTLLVQPWSVEQSA